MIYENYEFPIPSGCELMKVNRGYYVYLRLKATDKPKKICIGRCKFSADQTKTLIPNTNFFRHFNHPLPQRTAVRVAGRSRKCTAGATDAFLCRTALHLACRTAADQLNFTGELSRRLGQHKAAAVIEAAIQSAADTSFFNGSPASVVTPSVSLLWALTPEVAESLFTFESDPRKKTAVCRFTLPVSGTPLDYFLDIDSAQPLGFAVADRSLESEGPDKLHPLNTVTVTEPIYRQPDAADVLKGPDNGQLLVPLAYLNDDIKARLTDFRSQITLHPNLVQLEISATYPLTFHGISGRLLILFNREADTLQSSALTSLLIKTEEEHRLKNDPSAETSAGFGPFFEAAVLEASGKTVFQRREQAVEEAYLTCGCSLFFTTDPTLTPIQCRRICDAFRTVRRTVSRWVPDLLNLPTSCLSSLEYGFMLILHLSLVFRWHCGSLLHDWLRNNSCTLQDALDELSHLKLMQQENQWVIFDSLKPSVRKLIEQLRLPVQFIASADAVPQKQPTWNKDSCHG